MQNCLTYEKTPNGNLRLILTDEGREAIQELEEKGIEQTDDAMLELLESMLCNGFELLRPEEIGALTDCAIIISDDVTRNDEGEITKLGRVYWHPNYAVENPVETLKEHGEFYLTGGT